MSHSYAVELRKLYRGKKVQPGVLAEMERDGYIEQDIYDSWNLTAKGSRELNR